MERFRLWEGDAPGAKGDAPEDIPTLTLLGKPGPTPQAAFIVCPGGGYGALAPHESEPVAEWFESIGVRGLVLRYRLGPRYHHPVMLNDAQRAIRLARHRASEWGLDPKRIGILGFSAGGHLASTLSTHHTPGDPVASDPVERQSSRPDAAILIYPVISLVAPNGHRGSRNNLLGTDATENQALALSNERNVALDTPPTFLFHGADDTGVPLGNSLDYARALLEHRVPFALHAPEHGPHGFGMGEPGTPMDWRGLAEKWLRSHQF